jgi:hypothetical protein
MKQYKQKLELAIYGYDSTEFLPVFRDGELANRTQFIKYKCNRLMSKFVHV